MPLPAASLSCWGGDVVKFVLHLAEAITQAWRCSTLLGREGAAGQWAGSAQQAADSSLQGRPLLALSTCPPAGGQLRRPRACSGQWGPGCMPLASPGAGPTPCHPAHPLRRAEGEGVTELPAVLSLPTSLADLAPQLLPIPALCTWVPTSCHLLRGVHITGFGV